MKNDLHRPVVLYRFLKRGFTVSLWIITSILVLIPGLHYYGYDCFYEATGSYNLFFTCNTWSNQCLKQAGLKASLWTPFDRGTLYHYRK